MVLVNDNEGSRRLIEQCYTRRKTTVNPIIDWTDDEVWEFIKTEGIPYCKLYDEGWKRLGCIGCPMAGKKGREKEFARWPTYKKAYLNSFDKMLKACNYKPTHTWETPIDVFHWWMEDGVLPGQMDLFEDFGY